PPQIRHLVSAVVNDVAPARQRLRYADAQVGKSGFEDDNVGDADRCRNDDWRDQIRKQMPYQNSPPARAQCLRGSDEFRVLQRKNLTSDNTAYAEPTGQAEKHDKRPDRELRPRDENPEEEKK